VSRKSCDCPSLVSLPPRCAVWTLSSGLTAVTANTTEQSQPLPEVTGTGWRTFWLQQSTVYACYIPHGCAAEQFCSTTHFSIRPVRSPDLLVFPRRNEALPQIVSQLQKAVPVFLGWSDVLLVMEVSVRHCMTGVVLCVSVVCCQGLVF